MGNQYFADNDELEDPLSAKQPSPVVTPIPEKDTNPKQDEPKPATTTTSAVPLLLDVNETQPPPAAQHGLLTKLNQIFEQHPIDENGLDQYMNKQPEELRIGEVAHLLHLYKHLYKAYNQVKTATKEFK